MGLHFKSFFIGLCGWLLGWQLAAPMAMVAAPVTSRVVAVPFDSEYLVDSFGLDEGFPGNSCTGIGQTPDGYLWFSSFSGLARFNGLEFTFFTAENQPAIPDTRMVNCYTDRNGRLLVGTIQGLAMKLTNGWTNFPESTTWGNRELIRNFAEGLRGELFLSTSRGRIFQALANHLTELTSVPGHGGSYCAVDTNGQAMVVRGGFVGSWDGHAWQPFMQVENVVQRAVGVGQARLGGVWLVLTNQVVLIQNGQVTKTINLDHTVDGFWQLLEDRNGNLWLPSIEKGLLRIAVDGTVRRFGKADGLPNDNGTRAVFEDAAGSLWVGSGVGGVTRFRPARFHALGAAVGLPDVAITSMTTLNDGAVLVGTYGGGLAMLAGNQVTAVRNLPSRFVQSVLRSKAGEVLVGTLNDGLFSLKEGRVHSLNRDNPKLPTSVTALFEDSQAKVWIGSLNSVGYFEANQYHPLERPTNWQTEAVFFAERKNNANIIANQRNLYQVIKTNQSLALKTWLSLPESTRITGLLVDAQDRLWIGTAKSGLYVLAKERLAKVSAESGLPGNNINGLIESTNGQLWFGCGRNLVQADEEQLWQAASQTNRIAKLQIYNHRDGVGAIDFPDGFQPTSYQAESGRLWFALLRGAAAIDPPMLRLQTNPAPVVIESLSYLPAGSNQPVQIDLSARTTPVVLPPGSRQIQITTALLDFDAPEKNTYRFRLEESPENWHGNSSLNYVSFYDLSAGDHELFVQGTGGSGIASEVRSVKFRVEDYFWRQTWFWLLSSAMLVTITGLLTHWSYEQRLRLAKENLRREQEMAEIQARLASVLENTSDFVAFTDQAGNLRYLNQAGRSLLALPTASAVSSLRAQNLFSDWHQNVALLKANPATEVWSGEATLTGANNRSIPVSQVIISHRLPDGSLDFCSTIVRDVSQTKRNENIREALRSLSAALTAPLLPAKLGHTIAQECFKVFRHDAFFFFVITPAGEVQRGGYWEDTPLGASSPETTRLELKELSPALRCVLTGSELLVNRTPEQMANQQLSLTRFGHTDRVSASMMFAPVVWEGATVGVLSLQSYTPHRFDEDDLKLLRSFGNQCGPVIARLFAEEKLRQNEERLRLAMEAAKIGSWEVTLPTRELIATAQAEAIYGYPAGTMSGDLARLTERIPENEAAMVLEQFNWLFTGDAEDIECIHRLRWPDGTEKWLEIKGRLYRSADGEDSRAIGITADITERRQAELAKEQLENHLRQTHKLDALGTLAGGIAHDFNNILTGIIGYNDFARAELPPQHPALANLAEVSRGAARAKELVAQILTFGQRREQQRAPIALWPIVSEAMKLLRSSLPANITIHSQSANAETLGGIFGDATQIHQVIMNLGTNAAYAMRETGGTLTVREDLLEFAQATTVGDRSYGAGRYLQLTITDTGTGMPPDVKERIFEPFFSTKAPGEGTGLGLSVVHGILKSHEAEIQVTSELGQGTTFQITFPAVLAAKTATDQTALPPMTGSGQHILVIDDEERIVWLATRILQRHGYRVTSFQDPLTAVEAFREAPASFDLILTDLTMPTMSGVALAREIRKLRLDIPIILSTGFAGQSNRQEFNSVGIHTLLDKPYDVEALAQTVGAALLPKV